MSALFSPSQLAEDAATSIQIPSSLPLPPPISSSLHAMKQKGIIQNKKRRSNFTFFISLDFSV
jgi:hypothetical protein